MRADREKLKIAMARACMSIGDVAKAADMPYSSAKKVILGINVSPRTFGKVARALGVDVEEILGGEQNEN